MCFSPEASFTASAALAAIGGVSVRHAGWSRALPLAMVPLIFSVHQFMEGMNWRILGSVRDQEFSGHPSILVYTLIAFALWPIFVPLAVGLVEPTRWRRRVITVCGLVGGIVGVYFLISILRQPPTAVVHQHGIEYNIHARWILPATFPYIFAAIIACAVSSSTMIRVLGGVWWAASVLAYFLVSAGAFASTWCFFAAAISFCVVTHVRGWSEDEAPASVSTAHG